MSLMRAECKNCKTVFADVKEMKQCLLCGENIFEDADRITIIPKWHEYHGHVGFVDINVFARYVGRTGTLDQD